MEMSSRGVKIPIQPWWVALARTFIEKDENGQIRSSAALEDLGRALARIQGRAEPWSRTALGKFVRGDEEPTLELAEALCAMFPRLPKPFYFPRSIEESLRMQNIADRHVANEPKSAPDAPVHDMAAKRARKRPAGSVASHSMKNAR